jgi:hypothetical protein
MPKHIIRTQCLSLQECVAYIKQNSVKAHRKDFFKLTNDIKVWKRTNSIAQMERCIVALLIPKGAVVYAPNNYRDSIDYRKMRASEAIVYKQFLVGHKFYMYDGAGLGAVAHQGGFETEFYKEVKKTVSGFDYSFQYTTGTSVVPEDGFSFNQRQCESGIHFFVNLADAMNY